METPQIQYARTADGLDLAWQQWGSGPDVLVVPALISNVEMVWEQERYRRFLTNLGRHVRVVQFDKRGIGLSDRFEQLPTMEQRTGDIIAVMDAAGMTQPTLLALSEGGLMAQQFAADHPERVASLVLGNSHPGLTLFMKSAAMAAGRFDDILQRLNGVNETWGREPQRMVDMFCPSLSDNEGFVKWLGRFQRQSATSADLGRQLESIMTVDAFDRLGAISAETLVINSSDDTVIPSASGPMLAERIPRARHAMMDSADHLLIEGDRWDEFTDLFLEFTTGEAVGGTSERSFATVVFTDIVGSTERSRSAGDEAWQQTLESHDRIAARLAEASGGQIVKSTGDGLLVRFPSPSQGLEFCLALRTALGDIGLPIRAGVHAGEVEVRSDGDITGFAVNLAARVEQHSNDGCICVSSTVRDMLQGGSFQFADRGEHTLKGFDSPWRIYQLDTN